MLIHSILRKVAIVAIKDLFEIFPPDGGLSFVNLFGMLSPTEVGFRIRLDPMAKRTA